MNVVRAQTPRGFRLLNNRSLTSAFVSSTKINQKSSLLTKKMDKLLSQNLKTIEKLAFVVLNILRFENHIETNCLKNYPKKFFH